MDLKNIKNFFKGFQSINQNDIIKDLERYKEERLKYYLKFYYYHPQVTREIAEKLLKETYESKPEDGLFILRKSSTNPKDFSLSMIFENNVYHFQIINQIDSYFFITYGRTGQFHGLDSLISYFQERPHGLPCKLSSQFIPGECLPKKHHLNGFTNPLHLYAQNLDTISFKKFKFILSSTNCPEDLNENDSNGRSILDYACEYNNIPVVAELLARGVNVNVTAADGYTPLHRAALNNSYQAMQMLLEHPDINPIERNLNDMNYTPLHLAARANKFYCVKILLDYGVPDKPRSTLDMIPLDLAIEMNNTESIELLDSYIPKIPIIRLTEFFHDSSVNREIAHQILKENIKFHSDNVFLVRQSSKNIQNAYAILSILTKQNLFFNYEISKKNEYFYIDDGPYFNSLEHLIEHYMRYEDGLSTKLRNPIQSINQNGHLISSTIRQPIVDELNNQLFTLKNYKNLSIDKIQLNLQNNDKIMKIKRSDIKVLDTKLGEGEFGEVYKGLYKSKQVAIKILKDLSAEDEFKREAEIMSKLGDHPCILKIYGLVNDKKGLMMIQELMSGGILYKLWETPRSVTEEHLKKWATQIINGMVHLESKKIVHRDLAARNILLATEYQVKISDFGLSRFTNEEAYTQKSDGKIPVKWYSPESIELCKFTSKSDVWSFGITLWEMFSYGDVPYGDKNGSQVYQFIKAGKRLSCPRGCPINTYEIMKKCWEWEELKRPSFMQLLNEFLTDISYEDTGTIYFSNRFITK